MTTSANEKPTVLAEKMKGMRHRHIASQRLRTVWVFGKHNVIIDPGSKAPQTRINHNQGFSETGTCMCACVHSCVRGTGEGHQKVESLRV